MHELMVGRITRDWPLKPAYWLEGNVGYHLSGSQPTFCSSIDQGFQTILVFGIHHTYQGCIDPSSCFDTIEATYHKLELNIVIFIFVLDLSVIWRNLHSFHSLFDESSRDLGF